MAKAVDVACYFLNKSNREAGDAPTHLWVQKQVYYAQVWSLVFLGRKLFEDSVEAWENGPVTRSVWIEFKRYERDVIPEQPEISETAFGVDELRVLDVVWGRYGGLTAGALWKLSHEEKPWKAARAGLEPTEKSSNPISTDEMKSYYGDFGGIMRGELFIEPKASSLDKDKIFVTVCLTDGTERQVELSLLGHFIKNNAEMIQYEQSSLPEEGVELF